LAEETRRGGCASAFTGREWNPEIGLYYYRSRYYDPESGRFISEDPIGFQGGVSFYAYVRGNPAALIDPLGLKIVLSGISPERFRAVMDAIDQLRSTARGAEVWDQLEKDPTRTVTITTRPWPRWPGESAFDYETDTIHLGCYSDYETALGFLATTLAQVLMHELGHAHMYPDPLCGNEYRVIWRYENPLLRQIGRPHESQMSRR
jgi:RHS repeat-associated protein